MAKNPPIPEFPVRNLKLDAIAKLAHENWDLPKLKNPNLEPVAVSFRENIAMVRFMMLIPTSIAGQMASTQRAYDVAEYKVTQQIGQANLSPEIQDAIDTHAKEILEADLKRMMEFRETDGWDDYVGQFHLRASKSLLGLTETPLGAYGFIPLFSAHLTGSWTAIETMLGDLWEAALNCHPNLLASLSGNSKRISGSKEPANRKNSSNEQEQKTISINMIEMYKFDLRKCMGTLFRRDRRFEFTRLSSAREAYSRAFSEKSSRIDAALANKSLDALSAVRNVLLHKAGTADSEYVRQSSFLSIPKTALGEKVLLDGDVVARLVENAVASSKSLMIAVDDWISQN